jgi:hypothetical protein
MGGGPPSRIPPYIGVVDKKRGDNPVKEILGKIFWKVGVPLEHPTLCGSPSLIVSRSGKSSGKNSGNEYIFYRSGT